MKNERWAVRGVAPDAREAVEYVHEVTGVPRGRLLTEAIRVWYADLEVEEPIPAIEI